MMAESSIKDDRRCNKRPDGSIGTQVVGTDGTLDFEDQLEQYSFEWSTSTEPSVVGAFTQDGFVVLRNTIDQQALHDVWAPYASHCFEQCFRILYQNGHIAVPNTITMDGNYTMKQGMKNGYAELVMRSPGRYELSLRHLLWSQEERQNALPALPSQPERLL